MSRGTLATVDGEALRHNIAVAREMAPAARVVAVVKSNGYGHGLLPVARALWRDADAFAVTCIDEARPLREAGLRHPILLLEGLYEPQEITAVQSLGLDLVIHTAWQLEVLEAVDGPAVNVWLKVDSGMHRLGFAPAEVAGVHERLRACESVGDVRLMTHLARADDRGCEYTDFQIRTMETACAGLPGEQCWANSAGTLGWPRTHADWVRPGIMLYGASPFCDGRERPPLRPAMTLESRLVAISQRQRGDLIGYGGTYACPEDMPVGVVAIGYGDGYPRHAGTGTPVLINGQRAQLVGRVSMDMICVDLRRVPGAAVGDRVVLWGEGLPAEEVADHAGTIAYELFCQVTARVPFQYRDLESHGQG
ncbi:alanine racemase [Ectothiorhodospiraceae bacterium WFHF3C12]|nr:alanine racemase [Ectothiorhodospiraceae bacterium WFHF3C12]